MHYRLALLDRIAGRMNGWLLVLALGLGTLDLTVLVIDGIIRTVAALPH